MLVVAGAAVAFTSVPGLDTSFKSFLGSSDSNLLLYKVEKTRLPVTVVERGTLESANNKDVVNEVEGMTTIIFILPEGTRVKEGQKVCELDSAVLRDNLLNQEIATKRAKADLDQAQKTLEVAEISVQEYLEGTYPQEIQTAEGQIKLAESDLVRAKDKLEWSNKMFDIGYVTGPQNYADKLAKQKSEFSLQEAEKKLEVIQKYTKEKQVKELQAAVEKARSDMLAKQNTYDLEKAKEDKLRKQIDNCVLFAPNDGLIVYANEQNRFGSNNQAMIEEGAQVRERQKIFSLPDINNMQVNTKVHESMIDRVSRGLKARIRVDSFSDQGLTGTVKNVQPLPDPTSWMSSDIKQYTTLVTIDNGIPGLRPGMSAEVTILVTQKDDVLAIPVQAILQFKGQDHVYAITPQGPQRRVVELGLSNDKLVEVTKGLKEGDKVVLNPMSLLSEEEKRELFAMSSKSGNKQNWTADEVNAAGQSPGVLGPGGGGPQGKGEAAKKKALGGAGGAFMQKFQNMSPEDREAMKTASEEERAEILKKAGFTEDELSQMRQRMQSGGGGGGGFGGGRGGAGGGGGPRGGGEGGQ